MRKAFTRVWSHFERVLTVVQEQGEWVLPIYYETLTETQSLRTPLSTRTRFYSSSASKC